MSNNQFSPRDGKNIGILDLIWGLPKCYGLSYPLAIFLAIGSFILLRRIKPISLEHIGQHNKIEHNASLVHADCPSNQEYAPIRVDPALVDSLIKEGCPDEKRAADAGENDVLEPKDVAKFRVRREKECGAVDGVHAEIARGEMAIAFGVWGQKVGGRTGIPRKWLRDWFENDRLPHGWRPTHTQGLMDTIRRSSQIRYMMGQMRSSTTAA
jgi:hypothetical protein